MSTATTALRIQQQLPPQSCAGGSQQQQCNLHPPELWQWLWQRRRALTKMEQALAIGLLIVTLSCLRIQWGTLTLSLDGGIRRGSSSSTEEESSHWGSGSDHGGYRRRRQLGKSNFRGTAAVRLLAECDTYNLCLYKSDIEENIKTTMEGYRYRVDVYQQRQVLESGEVEIDDERLGSWYEDVSYTDLMGNEGIGTVSLVLDRRTGVTMSKVLGQMQLTVTGGSGDFGLCSGLAEIQQDEIDKVCWELHVCNTAPLGLSNKKIPPNSS